MIQRPSLSRAAHKVPERSGEVLIDPPLEDVPALLAAARDATWGRGEILGTPLREFRERVRDRALSIAGCRRPQASSPAATLVIMGHQPIFFHPGVWLKFFLLTRLHERLGVTGLYLRVDSDAPGAVTADVPVQVDHLTRRSETLLDLAADVPLEAAPAPTAPEWETFCARVRDDLGTLASTEVRARFEAFVAAAAPARAAACSVGQFLADARRAYEAQAGSPGYAELAVSALSDTPEFAAFALHLLQDAVAFQKRYNASLEEYRRIHRLRSAANPFPDLAESDGYVEAPFWVLGEGRRMSLFVQRHGDRLRFRTPAAPLADIPVGPAGVEALRAAGVRVRPRALALTMFARVCLGDLFIHGVGGGRYDQVTDAVIGETVGCAPPPFLVATATLLLPLLGDGALAEDGRVLERRVMDLLHNPERYLEAPSEAEQRLIDEKWSLIRAIEQLGPGPERRAATHRIREINGLLAQRLAGAIRDLRSKIAATNESSAARDAAAYRGYPFFLFDPGAVRALTDVRPRPA